MIHGSRGTNMPERCVKFSPLKRGRGEDRVPPHPWAPCDGSKHGGRTTGEHGSSGLPCAMVLTAYSGFSLVTGLVCHHHPCDAARIITSLTPASGRQDHTASPSTTNALRRTRYRVHRIPHPTSVTTRTPLSSRRDGAGDRTDFSRKGSGIFLESRLDKRLNKQPVGQINRPSAVIIRQSG
jgi:hypothetical protein